MSQNKSTKVYVTGCISHFAPRLAFVVEKCMVLSFDKSVKCTPF